MDTDEIIESGGDFENEEWDEEYNETEDEKMESAD